MVPSSPTWRGAPATRRHRGPIGGALAGSAIELGGTLGQSMVQLGDAALEPSAPGMARPPNAGAWVSGELAADIPVVPDLLRPIVRRLNQFGSVVISPKGVSTTATRSTGPPSPKYAPTDWWATC